MSDRVLLKHDDFEFGNILSNNYKIQEDVPDIIAKVTMADGSVRNNYGPMPKTIIKVIFGRMDEQTFENYLSHFSKFEDYFTYWSYKHQTYLTKLFEITPPTASVIQSIEEGSLDEWEVDLSQVGGEATAND